jgi:hypothetical protein
MMNDGTVAAQIELRVEGQPESGRVVGDAIAEEAGRRNADHRERFGLDEDGGADNGRIACILALPRPVADDRGGRG